MITQEITMANIPNVIKTGLADVTMELDRITLLKLEALLMNFMEKAVILGAGYAKESGRDVVTSIDIEYAFEISCSRIH